VYCHVRPAAPRPRAALVALPVPARFNDETMTLQNWPAKDNHIVIGEFHF